MSEPFQAEDALGGILLHLPATLARDVLSVVTVDDIANPHVALVVEVCRDLADRGVDPHPLAVMTHVRAHALVVGADALRNLHLLVADLYGCAPTPAGWRYYAVAVVEDAIRRRFSELGQRVQQAAEVGAIDVMTRVLDDECRAVRALLERRDAAGPDAASVHLRVAG